MQKLWLLLAIGVLLVVVVLNAWVSDDAYITFRTVFHFTEGFGPVYNVGERVQTYTNPLWMLVMSGAYLFTGEAYFTSLVLSLGFCLGGLWIMQKRIFAGQAAGIWVLALLVLSRSFVEYSTSGLENVLNFFLFMLFLSVWLGNRWSGRKQLLILALVAGFGMVSRMDTALLYAPAVFVAWWRMRSIRTLLTVAIGLLPFVFWEAFSLIYYGFPFPNTAYAKLNSGLPKLDLMRHGGYYFLNCLNRDPLSLAVIAGGLGSLVILPKRTWTPIALGVVFYLLYLIRVGGDFMGGRFFMLPVAIAAVMLGHGLKARPAIRWAWIPLLLLGLLNFRGPLYNWAREDMPMKEKIDHNGIADERAWYLPASSLMEWNDTIWVANVERLLDSRKNDLPGEKLLNWTFIGITGYGAGPGMHVTDKLALADPLLARLPMSKKEDWRIGHYPRVYPRGYLRSLRIGANDLDDPDLRIYLDKLWLVVRGPIWSKARWNAIWHFNLGHYNDLIDHEFYRNPSRTQASLSELQRPTPDGSAYLAEGQIMLFANRLLRIDLEGHTPFSKMQISLFGPYKYRVYYWQGKKLVGRKTVSPNNYDRFELMSYELETPKNALKTGFDAISVEPFDECGYFSVGRVKVGE